MKINTLKQWFPIIVVCLGALYFLYDNIVFLIGFATWVPDRNINLLASVSMLTGSAVSLFNAMRLGIIIRTNHTPVKLMKPVLAITSSLSLIFSISLSGLILFSVAKEKTMEFPVILITIFTICLIIVSLKLLGMVFKQNPEGAL